MDAELKSWKNEMENMLAAINRQTTHSLRVIKLIFKRCGRSLPPNFKQYFLQVSSNSLKITYEQFEIDSLLEDPTDINLDSLVNVAGGPSNNRQSGLNSEASNGQTLLYSVHCLDDEDFVMQTLETEPIDGTLEVENGIFNENPHGIENNTIITRNTYDTQHSKIGTNANGDLYEIGEQIAYQSNANGNYIIDPEASSDLFFAVEMEESNDSLDMIQKQNDLTDDDDNEVTLVNPSDEMTPTGLNEDKCETGRLNPKKLNKNRTTTETHKYRASLATKVQKSPPKQSLSKNRHQCTVCGYVGFHMGNLNRHMRTHTGEKPYGCDRCKRTFTSAVNLMNHVVTHIKDFPFHCTACFQGFALKAEAVAHEKCCRKRHFECHICKKYVTCFKADLIKHMRIHTGDKPFRCEICLRSFGQSQNLKRHLKTVHENI